MVSGRDEQAGDDDSVRALGGEERVVSGRTMSGRRLCTLNMAILSERSGSSGSVQARPSSPRSSTLTDSSGAARGAE